MPIDGTSSDKNDSLIDMVFERNEDLKSRLTSPVVHNYFCLKNLVLFLCTLDLQHTGRLY